MSARPTDSTWIRELRLSPCPRAQLVCFPHAGGTANFFRGWSRALPWTSTCSRCSIRAARNASASRA